MKRHLCCVTSSLSRKPRANKAVKVFYVNLKAMKSFKLFNRKMVTPQRKNDSWMSVTLFLTRRWLTFSRCLLKTDTVVGTTVSVLFCFCKKKMQSMVFPGNKKPSVKLWSQLEFTTWCNWEKLGSHSKDRGGTNRDKTGDDDHDLQMETYKHTKRKSSTDQIQKKHTTMPTQANSCAFQCVAAHSREKKHTHTDTQ